MNTNYELATFAGGCFWCMVKPFGQNLKVIKTVSGYIGGNIENPIYEEVCKNNTGHYEAVQITFDPNSCSYSDLINLFWQQINPTDSGGQFNDRGSSYTTAIFYHNENQKRLAEDSKLSLENSKLFVNPIVTKILPATTFYPAEDYHQEFYKKNPSHYESYFQDSGRKKFILENWKEFNLKKKLTTLEYEVTQNKGTEPPFNNEFWDNKKEGIYLDKISKVPLFSSKNKFESGTGWPSFTQPINDDLLKKNIDFSHGMIRTEIMCKTSNSHLGHLFEDGPEESGLRYCINSAALDFVPKEKLREQGFGQYIHLFE